MDTPIIPNIQCTSLIFQRITTRVYCVGSYKATKTPFCVGLSNLLPLDMKMNTIQFYDFVLSLIIFQRNGYWVLYALLDWNYMEFTIRSNKLPIDCHRLIDMLFFHCHARLLRLLVHLSLCSWNKVVKGPRIPDINCWGYHFTIKMCATSTSHQCSAWHISHKQQMVAKSCTTKRMGETTVNNGINNW